ncbi:restriction endonuclease [Streptomyces sp. NEAU-sy36]|uniref:NgoMIV family type II restriction endonuclease n=1 Tax=unclassified Streptomyces TaxID=2593676 RepID=UPI0015D5AFCF|nr:MULTISPECIES: NgoMIV family type II restriction endonuclease [unclassified Streptomyces]QLJ00193.1 restriction endonuclease [Streptomyces sp. NEAU-sy36]
MEEVLGRDTAPNIADLSQRASLGIAGHIFDRLQIDKVVSDGDDDDESLGKLLEIGVEGHLADCFRDSQRCSAWNVRRNSKIWDFWQYSHIRELREAADNYADIRDLIAADYLIDPDVTIDVPGRYGRVLRAVVSCKWTIRSDRAQNVRHEFNSLIRSRRGRAPHLVAVTAEPLPSRLSALTQGMGEIDAVYHVAYELLREAVSEYTPLSPRRGEKSQREHLDAMIKTGRLRDYRDLVDDILAE